MKTKKKSGKNLRKSGIREFDGIKKVGTLLPVRVPTRTGKPGKMGRHFPVREKSGNFEQTGKVRENHTKYWKILGIWDKYYLIFLVIFKWTVCYLLKWIKFSVKKIKHLKNTGKWQKKLEKSGKSQGILSVRKSGNPACIFLCGEFNYALDLHGVFFKIKDKKNTEFLTAWE